MKRAWIEGAVVALLTSTLGCAAELPSSPLQAPATPPSGRVEQQPAPESAASPAQPARPASYAALFDELAAKIETFHVFAEGRRAHWDKVKPALRAEMERAKTRADALVALRHVQNALGDRHCYVSPPTDLRPSPIAIGLALFAEQTPEGPRIRVSEVLDDDLARPDGPAIREGDEIVAVDGQPVGAFLEAHPFESNSLNERVALAETARAIVAARAPWTRIQRGDTRTLRLRRDGVERDVVLTFGHPSRWEDRTEINLDHAPPNASIGCRADKRPLYSGFELAAVGANVCVYRPTEGRADTRLVRFVSFRYDLNEASDGLRATRADHDLLARELKGARAVVLDLHENHGGNNPFVFPSWFASRPWDHQQVHVRVSPAFSEDDVRQFLFGDGASIARYREAAAAGKGEESWPFLCSKDNKLLTSGTCEGRGPYPAERVTTAPVAVITGPECTSSCDSFVADWSAFDMGPLVGQQPAHGFTSIRHSYALVAPDGSDLGRLRVALSWEAHPRIGKPLEGAPVELDWEAPSTFETRHTWVDLAVREARKRVER
jgi:hypothetical protein